MLNRFGQHRFGGVGPDGNAAWIPISGVQSVISPLNAESHRYYEVLSMYSNLVDMIPDHSDLCPESAIQLADAIQVATYELKIVEDWMNDSPTVYPATRELHQERIENLDGLQRQWDVHMDEQDWRIFTSLSSEMRESVEYADVLEVDHLEPDRVDEEISPGQLPFQHEAAPVENLEELLQEMLGE